MSGERARHAPSAYANLRPPSCPLSYNTILVCNDWQVGKHGRTCTALRHSESQLVAQVASAGLQSVNCAGRSVQRLFERSSAIAKLAYEQAKAEGAGGVSMDKSVEACICTAYIAESFGLHPWTAI